MTTKKTGKKTTRKAMKKTTKKTAKKATTETATTTATSKCPDSERAKVPGIVLRLKDMQNPCVLARMRGVPISSLRATQVMDGAIKEMVNNFE
jgi:hypothetical protein